MADMPTMEREKRLLKLSIARIQNRMVESLKKQASPELVDSLELDLADLRGEKTKFDVLQKAIYTEILSNPDEKKSEQELESEWGVESEKIRATLVNLLCRINAMKRLLESTTSRESLLNSSTRESNDQTSVRLPKIEVPTFSGDIRDWNDFSSLFKNLVHDNANLSNVQRLYYLKSAMKGNALELTRDYTITDANYVEVWTALTTRFENKRATVKAHLGDFFGLQKIKSEKELRRLLDESGKAMRSLKALGENVEGWNTLVTYWLTSRLDDKTLRDWEVSITDFTKFPSLKQLRTFLSARAAILEDTNSATKVEKVEKKVEPKRTFETKPKTNLLATKVKCYVCSANHYLLDCNEFKNKNVDQRFEVVKANHLCVNCFCKKHTTAECRASKCRVCDRKHHTMLHRNPPEGKEPSKINAPNHEQTKGEEMKVSLQIAKNGNEVILPTAVVEVTVKYERSNKYARVIFDSCSQANLISETLVRRLKLPTFRNDSVLGCLSRKSVISNCACTLTIVSRTTKDASLTITADVVPYIPYAAPSSNIRRLYDEANIQERAEMEFLEGRVEVLIGAEHYEKCMTPDRRFYNGIAMRNTLFGVVILGKLSNEYKLEIPASKKCFVTVDEQLRKFWELEETQVDEEKCDEEMSCAKHFDETIANDPDGRFVARLPLKMQKEKLSKLFYRAENALYRLERKCTSELKGAINEFMKDYETKGHMRLVENEEIDKEQYFIPYQIVLRPNSTTTKLRVVFNASAKSKGKYSLNDILMKGPQIQPDVMTVLAKFRKHRIAFAADIQQMYRQIRIHPDDCKLQKILWRYDPNLPLREYELTTVTYGTTPASYIATRCLEVISERIKSTHPRAAYALANEFYMDDLMTSAPDEKSAVDLQRQIHDSLMQYQFPLRKYVSNSPKLIESLDPDLVGSTASSGVRLGDEVSVLGLTWLPNIDKFQVKLSLSDLPDTITKRTMLSELSKTFDPLGFLAPATIRGKLLLQQLWRCDLSWDQKIPTELKNTYLKFRKQLRDINDLYIERKFCNHINHDSVKLCGFADASERAFAAVVYMNCRYRQNSTSYIVCAKTRVAPLNGSSIPRLELCGALLLAELIKKIAPMFNLPIDDTTCFTDSTTVLAWLNKSPNDLKTFVANRVRKVTAIVPTSCWKFVKSEENPADLATRGLKVRECSSNLWLRGPSWLNEKNREIYTPELSLESPPEMKKVKLCNLTNREPSFVLNLANRCSTYMKFIHTLGYVLRFYNNCRFRELRSKNNSSSLSPDELREVFKVTIRAFQQTYYFNDIDRLKRKGCVSHNSSLFSFHPFIDEDSIVRVGGRLENAHLGYERKHPILLPAKCEFTKLYLAFLHIKYFHASIAFLTTYVSQRFRFVAGLKNVIKKVCHSCVVCRRYSKSVMKQQMGQLPHDRTVVSRAFAIVGVDYAGPLELKPIPVRSKVRFKGYVAVFVCFSTRAVHLEAVSALTTSAFLAALKRFSARRGCPSVIYSDNASNFWGASNLLDDVRIENFDPENKIVWKFNPPRSPHFGGLFEAAVKSMKKHFVKVIGGQTLNFEELSTLASEVEAILNSRPIAWNRASDLGNYLTPGHFLTGTHLLCPPENDEPSTRLTTRWELVQNLKNSFWRRWRNDFLNGQQKCAKWHTKERNLQEGEIVFLKDNQTPAHKYLLGKVSKVFPGKDGLVRVAEVETTRGTFLRPVVKLSSAAGSMLEA